MKKEEGNKEEKSPVIKYWPQLLILCIVCISVGANMNSLDSIFTRLKSVESEHTHDVEYLNEEDNGVRGDFEAADECGKEIAKLENEVLYWKIKYEMK